MIEIIRKDGLPLVSYRLENGIMKRYGTDLFWRIDVIGVVADEDELRWLKMNFTNLPYPRGRQQVHWDGELARLIAQIFSECQ